MKEIYRRIFDIPSRRESRNEESDSKSVFQGREIIFEIGR